MSDFIKNIHPSWINLIGAFGGALVSGIFAICVFWGGNKAERNKNQKEILSFGKLYSTAIRETQNNYFKKQLVYMDEYIQGVDSNKYIPHRLNTIDGRDFLDRLRAIDIEKIHKLYFHLGIDSKNVFYIISYLDFLSNQLMNFYSDTDKILQKNYELTKQLKAIYPDYGKDSKDSDKIKNKLKSMKISVQRHETFEELRHQVYLNNEALAYTYPHVKDSYDIGQFKYSNSYVGTEVK